MAKFQRWARNDEILVAARWGWLTVDNPPYVPPFNRRGDDCLSGRDTLQHWFPDSVKSRTGKSGMTIEKRLLRFPRVDAWGRARNDVIGFVRNPMNEAHDKSA
jgi:hypothetical protein